jgi:hypothetical protein
MAAAIKRTTLKLGMIPADGIGKEVIPVRSGSLYKVEVETDERPLKELLKLLDLHFLNLNSSLYLLDGRSSIRMGRHFLMRLSGEFVVQIACIRRECALHLALSLGYFFIPTSIVLRALFALSLSRRSLRPLPRLRLGKARG